MADNTATSVTKPAVTQPEQPLGESGNPSLQRQLAGTEPEDQNVQPSSLPKGAGEEKDTFFDPKKVPAELQPAYKQMQADYTRKTQQIAEYEKKARAYDELVADSLLQEDAGVQQEPLNPALEEFLKTSEGNMLDQLIERRAKQIVAESLGDVPKKLADRVVADEIKEVREKYSDFDEYKSQIAKLTDEYPELPLEYLYKMVAFEGAKERGRKEAEDKLRQKKEGTIESLLSVSRTEPQKKAVSVKEAYEQAVRELQST